MPTYNVLDHGAAADGRTNDAAAIQKAIDACNAAGGGTVVLPAGQTILAGAFELKSNVEFRVERGGRLIASNLEADYPGNVFTSGPEASKKLWIGAKEAHDVAITGGGVIDGRCLEFATAKKEFGYETLKWRPAMTCFVGCNRMRIQDITLKDAANWALHFTGCEDVVVHGVSILNNRYFPNCDGIDPDHCRNVHISDCHIEAGDDCIVLKNTQSYKEYGDSENITVTNCTLMSTSCAIKIGSESHNTFRDLVFSNCIIKDSNRGIGIQLRDGGNVENVLFSNMIVETHLFGGSWWGAAEPIYVTVLPRNPETTPGRIRNVRFTNVLCRGENGIYIHGCDASRPDGILFDNVQLHIDKTTPYEGGYQDPRPCDMDVAYSQQRMGKPTPWGQRAKGDNPAIFAYKADGLTFRNTQVTWGENRPDYYTHAIEAHDVTDLRLEQFEGEAARAGLEAIARK